MPTWLSALPSWIPVATSVVAVIVSILAYRRAAPPLLPRSWIEVRSRGEVGAALSLRVENNTSWQLKIDKIRTSAGGAIALPRRPIPAPERPWDIQGHEDYVWAPSLPVGVTLAPNASLDFPFAIRLDADNSSAKFSMRLSVSLMRKTIQTRTIVIPTIVPAADRTMS